MDVPPSMTDYDDDGDDDRRLFPLSRIIESSLIKTAAVAGVVESFTFLLSQYHAHANSNFMFCSRRRHAPLIISTRRWAAGERAIQQSN